jgi:hypothetical protein
MDRYFRSGSFVLTGLGIPGSGQEVRMQLVVVLDCRDRGVMADFWCAALGYRAAPAGPVYTSLLPPSGGGPELLLQEVVDAKVTKNRLHLDLRVADVRAELVRLQALGARRLHDAPIIEDGWTWWVFADPEGNEFCALEPPPHSDQRAGVDAATGTVS